MTTSPKLFNTHKMAEQSQEGRAYVRHEIPMYGGHVSSKEIQLSLKDLKNNPTFKYLATVAETSLPMSFWIRQDHSRVWMAVEEEVYTHLVTTFLEDDDDVFVLIRPQGSTSPNTSPTASAVPSILSRSCKSKSVSSRPESRTSVAFTTPPRKFSSQKTSPGYFSQIERMTEAKNTIDPLWFEPIEETPLHEMVIVSSDDDKVTMCLPVDSLISLIKNSVEGGTSPFETKIISPEMESTIQLSIEVWKKWLIRENSGQEQFTTLFVQAVKVDAGRKQFLALLRSNTSLFFRICSFITDLRQYGSSTTAAKRIESVSLDAPMRFGLPYFNPQEAMCLLAGPLHPDITIQEALARRIEGKSMKVCASHDMAPFLMRSFEVEQEDLDRSGFKRFHETFRGLNIKDIESYDGHVQNGKHGVELTSTKGAEDSVASKKARGRGGTSTVNPAKITAMNFPTPSEMIETTEHDETNSSLPSLNLPDPTIVTFDIKCRLECLVYDLRRFSKDSGAMSRVEKANIYPFCIGPPYLSLAASEVLLNLTLSNNLTVREYLGGIAGGKGYHICTSHTLAPALAMIFNLSDDFDVKSSFKEYHSRFSSAARFCENEAALETTISENPVVIKRKNKRNK